MQLARIRRHATRLGHLLHRPVADQWLALQAFALLGHSRFLVKRRGLKAVQAGLGERMAESPSEITETERSDAQRIAWAINSVRIYTPWVSNCFPQAIAAHRLLRRRGISGTVYFGAKRATAGTDGAVDAEFAAHAWVRSGEALITGGDGHEHYTPIVWFGRPSGEGTK